MYFLQYWIFSICLYFLRTDDIEVLFYEERHDSGMNPLQPWQAKGRFGPNDVHHQVKLVHGRRTEEDLHDFFPKPIAVLGCFFYSSLENEIGQLHMTLILLTNVDILHLVTVVSQY